ncbi:MAG: adenylate/guanylate cyclase domain-containing protein [Deltaproteobacteria bacterium]|jgi:class 3 adenylate cyclase|nr:adenylate/guanylate cyclase domain-containing protein [Deltaproteobacteria bacterium]MBT4526673.1 adenylate/guanylate cyclase domain-containing protein [Deltaproteobacteria bacterium]
MKHSTRIGKFFDELLLFSGQYALFYILMNFTHDRLQYFTNIGHTLLLLILFFQTIVLVRFGEKPIYRFMGSLIAPLCYSILEMREGLEFLFNTGHVFFWIFSSITGLFQALQIKTLTQKLKLTLEFLITTINVTTFIFIYFYFDLKLSFGEHLANGSISKNQYQEYLNVSFVLEGLSDFLQDPAHIYIILGGLILSISLSIGRMRIIQLKDKVNDLFGKYVDKEIRDKILTVHGSDSERKEIAILFSDIRSFTAISEHHRPDEITKMLNFYFSQWDQSIVKYKGVIDKYIGDAVMVLFGISDNSSACNNAVACAMDMLKKMDHLKKELGRLNLPVIENIGVGVNFGSVIIGDIGSQQRKNFTVIGDNVNIASRLESLCKEKKVPLIISERTYTRLNSSLKSSFKSLDEALLKGKSDKLNVFGLETEKSNPTKL